MLSGKINRRIYAIVIILVSALILNWVILPRVGYKLRFSSGELLFGGYSHYSSNQVRILRVLIYDTPMLGEIPQTGYLSEKTRLNEEKISKLVETLSEYGDIALNINGTISKAFPWGRVEGGISVVLNKDTDSSITVPAAGAIYALSTASLLGRSIAIEGRLIDTGEPFAIEIYNHEIINTSHPGAVVYMTEKLEDSRFFSGPDVVRKFFTEDFNSNRLIRLDNALRAGDFISEKLKDKIE